MCFWKQNRGEGVDYNGVNLFGTFDRKTLIGQI